MQNDSQRVIRKELKKGLSGNVQSTSLQREYRVRELIWPKRRAAAHRRLPLIASVETEPDGIPGEKTVREYVLCIVDAYLVEFTFTKVSPT